MRASSEENPFIQNLAGPPTIDNKEPSAAAAVSQHPASPVVIEPRSSKIPPRALLGFVIIGAVALVAVVTLIPYATNWTPGADGRKPLTHEQAAKLFPGPLGAARTDGPAEYVRGAAQVDFVKTPARREGSQIVTRIQVKNMSNAPIARLTIDETWYDKDQNVIPGGQGVVNDLLQPGEVQTIEVKSPVDPTMRSSMLQFSHANGTVPKPHAVKSFNTTAAPDNASETYQLALISAKGYETESGGYHIVEGLVKNVSNQPLKNVTAVGIWSDKDGEFIKSDDAIIEYNPILPGQTSPFKTMSTGNPAMSRYRVEFKTLFGGTLQVDDQRRVKRK